MDTNDLRTYSSPDALLAALGEQDVAAIDVDRGRAVGGLELLRGGGSRGDNREDQGEDRQAKSTHR